MRGTSIDNRGSIRVFAIVVVVVILVAGLGYYLVSRPPVGATGGTVKVGMVGEINTLNPFADSSFTLPGMFVFYNFYDELYIYGPDPETYMRPWLAEEYESETVGDKTVVTLHLREDVKWWDGEPLTADDVVFTSYLVMNCHFTLWDISYVYQGECFVDAVEKVGDYTVKYTLDQPIYTVFDRLLQQMVVPKHQWEPVLEEAIEEYGEENWTGIATYIRDKEFEVNEWIGSGPFKLVGWERDVYLILEANEDYWAKGEMVDYNGDEREIGPFVDNIEVRFYGTLDSAVLALEKGDIDYVYSALPTAKLPSLIEDPDISTEIYDYIGYYGINFNQRTPAPDENLMWPMCDNHFRIAVAYLADREFLIDRTVQGYGEPIYSFVPYGMEKWYNPDVTKYGEGLSEVERKYEAYQVLKNAGYSWEVEPQFSMEGGEPVELTTKGSGLILPDGTPCPTIRLGHGLAAEDPVAADTATFFVGWMTDIGIPVEDRPMDAWTSFLATLFGDWEMNIWACRFGAVNMMEVQCLHSTQRPKIAGWLGFNSGAWIYEEFDELADQFVVEQDYTKKTEIIDQAQEVAAREVPWLTLWSQKRIEAYRTDRFEGWYCQPLYGIHNDVGSWNWLVLRPKPS